MNFWKSELGEITGNSEDAFVRDFTTIPNNTKSFAKISVCVNATEQPFNGSSEFPYIHIDWQITEGEFKGQKVKQKVKVFGDPNKETSENIKFKSLNMLKLIYKLFKYTPKDGNPPTDQELSFFCGKVAGITIREMGNIKEINEETRFYRSNWVSEVESAQGFEPCIGISIPEPTHFGKEKLARNSSKALRDNENFLASASDTRPQSIDHHFDDDLPF